MRWVFLLFPLLAQSLMAQQPSGGSDRDHELITQLLARVQQLEQEVKELKAQGAMIAPAAEPAHPPAPVAEPSRPPDATPAAKARDQQPMPGMEPTPAPGSPIMQFRGFSDVSYHADDLKGDTNSFALGQFNLFITSKLTDRINVLAEAVVEADQHNTVGIDLERVLIQYSTSDYFKVGFGRYHTAIGWYNTAYHHSTWMQTAVGRPFLFEFEDNGGILPIHNVGISASGRIPSGELGLHYVAEIGNGRASRSPLDEPVQNAHDENNGKAVNFAVLSRPSRLPGFEAGISISHDRLTPDGLPTVGQTIFAVHAIYQDSRFEWLNEALVIRNAAADGGRVVHTTGFYTQLSRKFNVVRPYFRYQYVNVPSSDLIFPDVGLRHGPSFGIRYDFSEFAAFKLQYDRTERRALSGFNGITTQLSFTF